MANNRKNTPGTPANGPTTTIEPPVGDVVEGIDPRTIAPPGAVVGMPLPGTAPQATPTPAPAVEPTPVDPVRTAMIEIPSTPVGDVYVSRSLGRRDLTPRQARTLTEITAALGAEGAALESGRKVATNDDAVAWILERVAESRQV
jgi:hypothetical protein